MFMIMMIIVIMIFSMIMAIITKMMMMMMIHALRKRLCMFFSSMSLSLMQGRASFCVEGI
jgi:hypothetical protein